MPPAHHGAHAPVDGGMLQLPAGPVTALDVVRLFPADEQGPVVIELGPGELQTVIERHAAIPDPRERAGDDPWWNWCRMPAGVSIAADNPTSAALVAGNVPLVAEWLDRELTAEPAPVTAADALTGAL